MPRVDVNDVAIHYEDAGEGPVIVLVHGLGSSVRDWERQIPVLSRSHRVVAVDLRGHGNSSKPPGPYSIEGFAADTAAVLETLEIESATFMGISLGGMIVFQVAATRPEMVERAIVVNALPDNDLLANAKAQIAIRKVIVRILGLRKMGEVLAGRLFPAEDMEAEREMMIERWAENDKGAYRASFDAILKWPGVTDVIAEFDKPLLMVSADEDYVSLDQKQPYLDRLPAIEHVVIEDARHAVPVERPEQFNQVVEDFLANG